VSSEEGRQEGRAQPPGSGRAARLGAGGRRRPTAGEEEAAAGSTRDREKGGWGPATDESPAARALAKEAEAAAAVALGAMWPVVRAPMAAATTSRGAAMVAAALAAHRVAEAAALLGSMGWP
jgi:hypothetical protein